MICDENDNGIKGLNKVDNEDTDANNDLKNLNAEKEYSGCDLNTYPRFRTDVFSS